MSILIHLVLENLKVMELYEHLIITIHAETLNFLVMDLDSLQVVSSTFIV